MDPVGPLLTLKVFKVLRFRFKIVNFLCSAALMISPLMYLTKSVSPGNFTVFIDLPFLKMVSEWSLLAATKVSESLVTQVRVKNSNFTYILATE